MTHTSLGLQAEQLTARYLQDKGFVILEQNYRKRFGEIDIIAKDKTTIRFVEVKARHTFVDMLAETITLAKQKKIIKVARTYLAAHSYEQSMVCQFDVALVDVSSPTFSLVYLEDAFT